MIALSAIEIHLFYAAFPSAVFPAIEFRLYAQKHLFQQILLYKVLQIHSIDGSWVYLLWKVQQNTVRPSSSIFI
jgi:hypothetical protein